MKSSIAFAVLSFGSMLAAQSATVGNVADSGPGSLRAALIAANASASPTFTIDVAAGGTSGPIVLASQLPTLQRPDVTIRALPGAGRLVVDARGATVTSGRGLEFSGDRTAMLAPCRVLVQQGHGIVVRGAASTFADVEVSGGSAGAGLTALATAHDLAVRRFRADHFTVGLQLQGCDRAHVADDGVSTAEARLCTGAGFQIADGDQHVIGSFVATENGLGLSATGCGDLRLGGVAGLRAVVALNGGQGAVLQQCTNATVSFLDAIGNGGAGGGAGLTVVGGTDIAILQVGSAANLFGGVSLTGGVTGVRIGPAVLTSGFGGAQDVGISIRHASSVVVLDCTVGPGHQLGVVLGGDAAGNANNVTLARCAITGNQFAGVSAARVDDALLCSSTITGNGVGVEVVGAVPQTAPQRLVIANCRIAQNAGQGVTAQNTAGLRLGPGLRVDDNLGGGIVLHRCLGPRIDDASSISRNRGGGVRMVECTDAVVERATLADNRVTGISAGRCAAAMLGPEITVRDTIGTGVQLEYSEGCRLFSSRITASTAHGLHVLQSLGVPSTNAHVVQSCLFADHPGLAIYHANGPPVSFELCTIAGNLRGVAVDGDPVTFDSCIVVHNLLADLPQSPFVTVRNTFHQTPSPVALLGNTAVDPLFVSPANRDWRLQPNSPAAGHASTNLAIAPGAVDAWAGPRTAGAVDAGAYEIGPHAPPPSRLVLGRTTMLRGGSGVPFRATFPPSTAGMLSLVLLELGPPSGSFPAFGALIPLAPTPALLLATDQARSVGTVAVVGGDGVVEGALSWTGHLPQSMQNQVVSLCAVAMDLTPHVHAVTNVASFTVQ